MFANNNNNNNNTNNNHNNNNNNDDDDDDDKPSRCSLGTYWEGRRRYGSRHSLVACS